MLILASQSEARYELLQRLHIPFERIAADIDESRLAQEGIHDFVERLASEKAQKIAAQYPQAVVIGSDEVMVNADTDADVAIGKPLTHENAVAMWLQTAGCTVEFLTALCVLSPRDKYTVIAKTQVRFRKLSVQQIEHYLSVDKPYQCAGGFRSEGLGIALCESIVESEPGALMGLPLISVCNALYRAGVEL